MTLVLPQLVNDLPLISYIEIKNLQKKKTIEWTLNPSQQLPLTRQAQKRLFFDVTIDTNEWFFLSIALQSINQLLLRSVKITIPLANLEKFTLILQKSPYLEALHIENNIFLNISPLFNVIGTSCLSLKRLQLKGISSQDAICLERLLPCTQLEMLDLSGCLGDIETGLIALLSKAGKKLQHLLLHRCSQITTLTLRAISEGCPKLRTLNIGCCPGVSAESLDDLNTESSSITHLFAEEMTIEQSDIKRNKLLFSRLEELSVRNSLLTDSTLYALGKTAHSLKKLNISSCPQITVEGLETFLIEAKNLNLLDITDCILSQTELSQLQSKFPSINMMHELLY